MLIGCHEVLRWRLKVDGIIVGETVMAESVPRCRTGVVKRPSPVRVQIDTAKLKKYDTIRYEMLF